MRKMLDVMNRPVNPSPAALITSVDQEGRPNILTLGEVFNVSIKKPLIMGIAIREATYSHSLIKQTGEFVINLTTPELVEQVDRCGGVSGRNGIDKFKEFGLTPVPAAYVKAPLVEECPVNIECKVISIQKVGDHDLILGEVAAVHANEEKIDAEGKLKAGALDLLVYMSDSYWSLGKKLGDHGFTKAKN